MKEERINRAGGRYMTKSDAKGEVEDNGKRVQEDVICQSWPGGDAGLRAFPAIRLKSIVDNAERAQPDANGADSRLQSE